MDKITAKNKDNYISKIAELLSINILYIKSVCIFLSDTLSSINVSHANVQSSKIYTINYTSCLKEHLQTYSYS